MIDDMYEVGFGQATSDGDFDDVDIYGSDGTTGNTGGPLVGAWFLVIGALIGLWLIGAVFLKGANHS